LSSIKDGPQICPECNAQLNSLENRDKIVVSLLGSGPFQRTYYKCPNGHGHFLPRDSIIGVQGTAFTPGVRLAASKLAVAGSFEWTSETLAEIAGIYVSPKEVQRISESAGEFIETKNQERIDAAMCPVVSKSDLSENSKPNSIIGKTLYIEYDGTGIPMTKKELAGRNGKQTDGGAKTREVKVGCVFTQTAFDKNGHPIRDNNSTSYVGAIENAEKFGWRIYAETIRRDIEAYERVVVIGDGAKWIWGIACQHFPNAIQIVDLYHAKEHLYQLVRDLFPKVEQSSVLDDWIKTLEAGKIKRLAKKIRSVDGLNEDQQKKANKEANYFAENAKRMRYNKYKKKGLFVGSGVVEAGCKTVIGKRLKQSGMFWSVSGANAIISLRCANLSCNEDFASHFVSKQNHLDDQVA
jgi:hypothetical protein